MHKTYIMSICALGACLPVAAVALVIMKATRRVAVMVPRATVIRIREHLLPRVRLMVKNRNIKQMDKHNSRNRRKWSSHNSRWCVGARPSSRKVRNMSLAAASVLLGQPFEGFDRVSCVSSTPESKRATLNGAYRRTHEGIPTRVWCSASTS